MTAAASLDPELERRVRVVTARCGLSLSDVVRQGLVRIVVEVEATGALTCHPLPAREMPPVLDEIDYGPFRRFRAAGAEVSVLR